MIATTEDRFLGGRVVAAQPVRGFRAGHDSVFLAAAVPAADGDNVLELGAGAGVASLCLAARIRGCRILGVEIDPALVTLANANARRNGFSSRLSFIPGDARNVKPQGAPFDHVFFNPPFHLDSGHVSPDATRDRAKRDTEGAIAQWTIQALALVRTGGTVTAILRADRLDEALASTPGEGAVVFPLLPHAGEAPKRVLVRIRKGEREPIRFANGLLLHEKDGRNTPEAEAVLRQGEALDLTRA